MSWEHDHNIDTRQHRSGRPGGQHIMTIDDDLAPVPAAPAKSNKTMLIAVGIIAVAAVAVAYFIFGRSDTSNEMSGPPETIVEIVSDDENHFVPLGESFVINLADGHYLKVAVVLEILGELDDPIMPPEGEEMTMADEVGLELAPARDTVITTLSGMKVSDLDTQEDQAKVKALLLDQFQQEHGEKVHAVLFTDFVMQ
jgi:flagellar basal body-associated protein FliL